MEIISTRQHRLRASRPRGPDCPERPQAPGRLPRPQHRGRWTGPASGGQSSRRSSPVAEIYRDIMDMVILEKLQITLILFNLEKHTRRR